MNSSKDKNDRKNKQKTKFFGWEVYECSRYCGYNSENWGSSLPNHPCPNDLLLNKSSRQHSIQYSRASTKSKLYKKI